MATLRGDNQVDIRIQTTADTKGVSDTTSALAKLGGSGSIGGQAMGMLGLGAKAAAAGVLALGASAIAAGTGGIKLASDFESSRVAFETMLGSADAARSMMVQVADFAKATPFELPDVVTGAQRLLAFGVAQDQIIPKFKMLGDISMGNKGKLDSLLLAYGKIQTKGKASMEELNIVLEAGVPILDVLSKQTGIAKDQIIKMASDGKISLNDVTKAFESMTKEGGFAFNGMEKQSKTFNGVVSNIKDGFGQILRSAVGMTQAGDIIEGSLFDRVKKGAEASLPYIQRFSEMIGPMMIRAMSETGQFISGVTQKLRELWAVVGPIIVPALQQLWAVFKTQLLPALQEFWAQHGPMITQAAKVMAVVFGAALVGALLVTIEVLKMVIQVTAWLTSAFTNMVNWTRTAYNYFYQNVVGMWNIANSAFNWIIGGINNVIAWFRSLPNWIQAAVGGIGAIILSPFIAAWNWIVGMPSRIVSQFWGLGGRITSAIGNISLPGLGALKNLVPGFAVGGYTGRGGVNEVAGVVHKGEYVLPQSMVDQSTGLPKSSLGGGQVMNIYGDIHLNTAEAVDRWAQRFDRNNQLAQIGLTPMGAY